MDRNQVTANGRKGLQGLQVGALKLVQPFSLRAGGKGEAGETIKQTLTPAPESTYPLNLSFLSRTGTLYLASPMYISGADNEMG